MKCEQCKFKFRHLSGGCMTGQEFYDEYAGMFPTDGENRLITFVATEIFGKPPDPKRNCIDINKSKLTRPRKIILDKRR